ncbi:prolyl aminopeptidase-like protein [Massariosphaeria phaeospora]|uniref:Prolyl aminopeptidase-like protein n=1 Tax=Massariosphaeria phaeospora TaxID=100035 RepID=A0A7C8ICP7_9PLEO|nr:prolyl aminopeptidase-like protein [Massariosphaeria phaeospora]
MSRPLPTVVFFAGAFANPSCFDQLSARLEKAGYSTVYAHVPSLNPPDTTNITTSKDSEQAREGVILPLLDDGKDVVIFVHSYGGVVGGAAAAGLSTVSRSAEGKKGGVLGLLYLVGNIVGEGETLLQAVGGAYPPFIKQDTPSKGLAVIDPVMETLYGDADPALAPKLEDAMVPHALAAFETPATKPAWAESAFDGRRAYIRTLDDQCNPLFLQDMWIQKSGVEWTTADLKSSHCPFISKVEDVAAITIELIKKWQ